VGLWSLCDVDDAAELTAPLIVENELRRRLPGVRLRHFAPLGELRPLPRDGGRTAETLAWTDDTRLDVLAAELDCVVITGAWAGGGDAQVASHLYGAAAAQLRATLPTLFIDGLGPDREQRCPVSWHAVGVPAPPDTDAAARLRSALGRRALVTVDSDSSLRRLAEADAAAGVVAVPEPLLLLDRLWPAPALQRRERFLRIAEWLPREGAYLLVQGDAGMVPLVDGVAATVTARAPEGVSVVIATASAVRGDAAFADALAARLPGAIRLPPEVGCDDLAAAVTGAVRVIAGDRFVVAAALAHGVPLEVGDAGSTASLGAGLGATAVERARDRLEQHFDTLAAFATAAARARAAAAGATPPAPDEPADALRRRLSALQRAHELRSRRLSEERAIFQAEFARLAAERRAVEADRDRLAGELAAQRAELEGLRGSKTWRYTEPLRTVYRRLRRG
jgi:hypothetical protein